MTQTRIAVTGLGLVTPLGNTVDETWKRLLAGVSGISTITHFDAAALGLACQVAGEVKNFDASDIIPKKDMKKCDRFIHLGWAASDEALRMAGLVEDTGQVNPALANRFGCILGSGIGGLAEIERTKDMVAEKGYGRISPFFIPAILINMLGGQVSMAYGLKGANVAPVSACATGTHAIGEAAKMIQRGEADVMLAGGAEAAITPLSVGGFGAARALSTQYNATPTKASRPFDTGRDGFVMGEGAGVMVLENWEHAVARGATILAEFTGFGQTADAYHMTLPSPEGAGAKRAMEMAIADAGITGTEVDYINAHATSTPAGDAGEARAIGEVCGQDVVISGTKSMTGHLLGAAGGIEAAFAVLSLMHQTVPPTINVEMQDPDITLDVVPYIKGEMGRKMPLTNVLSNSFGFGGTNATLTFRKA